MSNSIALLLLMLIEKTGGMKEAVQDKKDIVAGKKKVNVLYLCKNRSKQRSYKKKNHKGARIEWRIGKLPNIHVKTG